MQINSAHKYAPFFMLLAFTAAGCDETTNSGSTGGSGGSGGSIETGGSAGMGSTGGSAGTGGFGGSGGSAGTGGSAGAAGAGGSGGSAGSGGSGGGGNFNSCGLPVPANIGAATGLFDLGHVNEPIRLIQSGDRVLSHDANGRRWILWDTTTHTGIASGNSHAYGYVGMSGNLVVIQTPTGLDLRAAATGQTQGTINAAPNTLSQIGIADDGSYAWATRVGGGLKVWSPQGTQLLDVMGDYSGASIFAAPMELRIAKGPAGANRIETIPLGGGAPTLSPTFSQNFHSWMQDGERFFAVVGTAVFIYSKNAALVASAVLSSTLKLAGSGDYFWTQSSFPDYSVQIYTTGSGDMPIATHSYSGMTLIFPSKRGVAVFPYGEREFSFIHLDPQATKEVVTVPFTYLKHFAVDNATGFWTVANWDGAIFHRGSSQSPQAEGTLGCGAVLDIAGTSTGKAVVTMASDQVVILDLNAGGAAPQMIPVWAEKAQLSEDGSVLVTWDGLRRAQYAPWFFLHVFSLPAANEVHVFPESVEFSLSSGGKRIGFTDRATMQRFVMDLNAMTTFFLDNMGVSATPLPSPNGENIAVSDGKDDLQMATYLYKANPMGGAAMLVNAVPGRPVGWINDDRLLVYTLKNGTTPPFLPVYDKTIIYDAQGNVVATPVIPKLLKEFDVASPSTIYSPEQRAIYDWNTGTISWTSPLMSTKSAAVGNKVVMAHENGVYVTTF